MRLRADGILECFGLGEFVLGELGESLVLIFVSAAFW